MKKNSKKKTNKLVSALIIIACVFSLFVCCDSSDENTTPDTSVTETTIVSTESTTEESTLEQTTTDTTISTETIETAIESIETENVTRTESVNDETKMVVEEETEEPTAQEETEEEKSGITVYITPTGKKYHYSSSCAGKNAIERDLDDVSGSYGPCKKCAQ